MVTLDTFYQSKPWIKLTHALRLERLNDNGELICARCGQPITRKYDAIAHHVTPLTESNVNDAMVALNPDNVQFLHARCHNLTHDKLGYKRKEIYLVYGSPLAGKSSYVDSILSPGDLLVDIDRIWECVSGQPAYIKPPRLNSVVFSVRDCLYNCIRMKSGKWNNAYIVGGFPLVSERERLCKMFGAREILVECSREECLRRLEENPDGRDKGEWRKYIDAWWQRYSPSPSA